MIQWPYSAQGLELNLWFSHWMRFFGSAFRKMFGSILVDLIRLPYFVILIRIVLKTAGLLGFFSLAPVIFDAFFTHFDYIQFALVYFSFFGCFCFICFYIFIEVFLYFSLYIIVTLFHRIFDLVAHFSWSYGRRNFLNVLIGRRFWSYGRRNFSIA